MAVSFMHRITGTGLALAGTGMLLWFLTSVAAGPEAYETFRRFAGSWFGTALLVGLTWAVFQHMGSGIRHLFMDVGAGYELRTARRSSILVFVLGPIATAAFWGYPLILK